MPTIETATKETKYSYETKGAPFDNEMGIRMTLHLQSDKFPLLNSGHDLFANGSIGNTGITVTTADGTIAAAVRHPKHIPTILDTETGVVEFGGKQCDNHLETALEIPVGMEQARKQARIILSALDTFSSFAEVSRMFGGLGAVGSEPESWMIDSQTGNLVPYSGGELQLGLLEETIEAISDPYEFRRKKAAYNMDRKDRVGEGTTIIDTSVLPTGSPMQTVVNNGENIGPYVQAVQTRLFKDWFNFSDPQAEALMDQVAKSFGFNSHAELKAAKGDMAYWAVAASHASVGLHHLRSGNKALYVPTEIAIAVADSFNSDLATVVEFLMFSSPVVFGITPALEVDGQLQQPRDYRVFLRYLMDTTNPAPFIDNPQEMYERINRAIRAGITHTMDRGSYLVWVNNKLVSIGHGRVRNRISSSEPRNQTGRIEFTGCNASPSTNDELARNCFLQVLTIAAHEAAAAGMHPRDYFAEEFPSLNTWERQKDLIQKASLFGFNHPEVSDLIDESIRFLRRMEERYPILTLQAAIAEARLRNLRLPAVKSLDDYARNPRGPISEVIQSELAQGVDPLEIARRIEKYQLATSQMIVSGIDQLPNNQTIREFPKDSREWLFTKG